MAILAKFEVKNMPAATYDEVIRRLEAAGAGAPPGRLYHISYGNAQSLQVLDVYDKPESFQAFGKTLVPILQELGVQARPEIQEVHNTIAG
ncbi:MAG TPA: hypothetical protein VKX16_18100 [Chloroflexota bacterium]|nr:hypothetical protein [Chloroflexota bacterium]